jgi:hypothetical protein
MGKFQGGLTGFMTGKVAGFVGSTARGLTGKVNTVKQYVIPSNPNTQGQQDQRNLFARAVAIIRNLSASLYQSDWDRAVGQLPGFQSLQSVILNAKTAGVGFNVPATVNLGSLHHPDDSGAAAGGASGEIDISWSTELGVDGTNNDQAVGIAYAMLNDAAPQQSASIAQVIRSAGATGITFTGLSAGSDYVVGLYFRGAGDALGKLSPCKFWQQSATA